MHDYHVFVVGALIAVGIAALINVLASLNATAVLFPVALVICNSSLVAMILLRRKQLGTVVATV